MMAFLLLTKCSVYAILNYDYFYRRLVLLAQLTTLKNHNAGLKALAYNDLF